jgi:AcrR family transcriptional regulator
MAPRKPDVRTAPASPITPLEQVFPLSRLQPTQPLQSEDTSRPERSDAVENRRRILDVAERLFAERGVEAVCMQEIARAAGVGQGTLYRRFAGKGELCMALLDSQMHAFQEEVLRTLRDATPGKARNLERLEWFLDALVRFSERHGPLLSAARSELHRTGQDNLTQRSTPFAWMRATVVGLLAAGARTGEVRADLDAPVVADLLLSALHPQQLYTLRHGPDAHSLTRIRAALRQLVRGLAAEN